MDTAVIERIADEHGTKTLIAEFHTHELTVGAQIDSPEGRLSDHLNGSVSMVAVQPLYVTQNRTGESIELETSHAIIEKDHVLFVVPIAEPPRPSGPGTISWRRTNTLPCWASIGPFKVNGTIHLDAERGDPRIALRLIDRRFLPLTNVRMTGANGETREYSAVLVNRTHIDMLALLSFDPFAGSR